MKYLCLIYDEEKKLARDVRRARRTRSWASTSPSPTASRRAATTWAARRCSRCRPPRPSACATARSSTTDGPFAETKEQLGGYYLIEARDLNDAIQVAVEDPVGARSGSIEVRPIMEFDQP